MYVVRVILARAQSYIQNIHYVYLCILLCLIKGSCIEYSVQRVYTYYYF